MDLQLVEPAKIREFVKGRFELHHVGGTTLGRATYEEEKVLRLAHIMGSEQYAVSDYGS